MALITKNLERRSKCSLYTYVRGGEQFEKSCTMTRGQVLDMNVITNLRPTNTDPLDQYKAFNQDAVITEIGE